MQHAVPARSTQKKPSCIRSGWPHLMEHSHYLSSQLTSGRMTKEKKMNYIYMLLGTLFTVTLVAQLMAYAASTRKSKVNAARSLDKQD